MTAASMASRAEPPRVRMDQPAASARWQPDLQASTASSGMSHAPPWTIREGFIEMRMAKGIEVCQEEKKKKLKKKRKERLNTEIAEATECAEKKKPSNKQIENEEKQANQKKYGAAIEAAAREAAQRANKGSGDGFETRFFADAVERADRSVAREIAPEDGNFVMNPDGEVVAVAPHQCSAAHK